MTYRERREAKADRLRSWADKRRQDAARVFKAGEPFTSDIAFNTQPGHIPFRARLIAREDRAYESVRKAAAMTSRAAEIERQADHAIYRDDPDAIARLIEKIATMEARRDAMKAANAAFRTSHRAELKAQPSAYERDQMMPHQAYESQNLSGNITRARQRLAGLQRDAAPPVAANRPTMPGETATARAGLTVAEGLTTPSRPGKRPRTVYTVTGETLHYWRSLLIKLGGKPWGYTISFWDDPTAEIEAAIAADEPAQQVAQ